MPDFFIVGAPKCGTTAMQTYLRQHPQVFMPARIEPNFFNIDMYRPGCIREPGAYLGLFAGQPHKARLGEASPWYLYSKSAAAQIRSFCGLARIIIMLRDPVEMMYSLHSHLVYKGCEDIVDFASALAAESARRRGVGLPKGSRCMSAAVYYRDVASYSGQVERYLDTFGRQRVHFIIFDDFARDPSVEYQRTLAFLGIDEAFRPRFYRVNPGKAYRSRDLLRFTRMIKPRSDQRRHPIWPLYKALKTVNTRVRDRRPVDPVLQMELRAEFAPEVARVSALVKRDLTHWSRHNGDLAGPESGPRPAGG